ncbi:hypothetical protein J7J90_02560 [Candidatus Micrarchaeota archaeon]|nr:hypothetical protein [Candidatus Micrarchaeota archaeon]
MNISTAVKYALRKYEGKPIREKELKEIKKYIVSKTGQGKYTGLSTIRKWVNEAKKEIKQKKKITKKKKSMAIAEKTKAIKQEIYKAKIVPEQDTEERKVVAMQNISYEMAAIRQFLQRINKQLDSVEELLRQIKE